MSKNETFIDTQEKDLNLDIYFRELGTDFFKDIEKIEQLLEDLELKETQLDVEIKNLLPEDCYYEKYFAFMKTLSTSFQDALVNYKFLYENIKSSSKLAKQVSSRVRLLDCAQKNVSATLAQVQNLLDLQWCYEGIEEAIKKEDYDNAAVFIEKFLTFDQSLLDLELNDTSTLSNNVKKVIQQIKIDYEQTLQSSVIMRI